MNLSTIMTNLQYRFSLEKIETAYGYKYITIQFIFSPPGKKDFTYTLEYKFSKKLGNNTKIVIENESNGKQLVFE